MQYNGSRAFSAEIRELRDLSDCYEVIRCLRSAFGDSYIKSEMYSPHRILDMHRSGEMHLFLAVTDDGSAAGIMGWEEISMFPGTAELCTLVVRPEYGGSGLGQALIRFAYDIVKQMDITSVFSYPIANHLKAQRCIENLHPVCCGFLPSVFSVEKFKNGETGHKNPKDSLTVVSFNINKKDVGALHIKEQYHPLAAVTYSALGASIETVADSIIPMAEKTAFEYRYDSTHSTLYININIVGRDFVQLVSELISHRSDDIFTAELCLDMYDSSAVYAADILEREGFFFTGFHPLCRGREYCIYHYGGNVAFDIDDLDYIDGQRMFADCIKQHTKEAQK